MDTSDDHETPSTFRRILRELPRKMVALVALVVVVNLRSSRSGRVFHRPPSPFRIACLEPRRS
jgi:hypothetical protein